MLFSVKSYFLGKHRGLLKNLFLAGGNSCLKLLLLTKNASEDSMIDFIPLSFPTALIT
jgi:hypothetical protein